MEEKTAVENRLDLDIGYITKSPCRECPTNRPFWEHRGRRLHRSGWSDRRAQRQITPDMSGSREAKMGCRKQGL